MSLNSVVKTTLIQNEDEGRRCEQCTYLQVVVVDPDTCLPVAAGEGGSGTVTIEQPVAVTLDEPIAIALPADPLPVSLPAAPPLSTTIAAMVAAETLTVAALSVHSFSIVAISGDFQLNGVTVPSGMAIEYEGDKGFNNLATAQVIDNVTGSLIVTTTAYP